MQPTWFLLLREQQHRGITADGLATTGRIGLTIPFLAGAMLPAGSTNVRREDLKTLLESMRDSAPGKSVVIGECVNMHQPRVSLTDNPGCDPVLCDDGSSSNLFAWNQYFSDDSRTVHSLADELWRLHGDQLSTGRFSYRANGWHAFNEDELEFIKRALRDPDDV